MCLSFKGGFPQETRHFGRRSPLHHPPAPSRSRTRRSRSRPAPCCGTGSSAPPPRSGAAAWCARCAAATMLPDGGRNTAKNGPFSKFAVRGVVSTHCSIWMSDPPKSHKGFKLPLNQRGFDTIMQNDLPQQFYHPNWINQSFCRG